MGCPFSAERENQSPATTAAVPSSAYKAADKLPAENTTGETDPPDAYVSFG